MGRKGHLSGFAEAENEAVVRRKGEIPEAGPGSALLLARWRRL